MIFEETRVPHLTRKNFLFPSFFPLFLLFAFSNANISRALETLSKDYLKAKKTNNKKKQLCLFLIINLIAPRDLL